MQLENYNYKNKYDSEAEVYNIKRFGNKSGNIDKERKNEVIVELLNNYNLISENIKIVDLAAGTGRITHELVKHKFKEIHAVDISEKMLEINKKEISSSSLTQPKFKICSIDNLDYPNNYFDIGILGSFLYLFPITQYPVFIKEIFRVLKSDGILICEVSNLFKFFNPISTSINMYHKFIRKTRIKSYISVFDMYRIFKPLQIINVRGVSYPFSISKSTELFNWFSSNLLFKYFGGKFILVLKRGS